MCAATSTRTASGAPSRKLPEAARTPRKPRCAAFRSRPNAPLYRNVIILFADDYGWGDVGHNNPLVTETAAIDALAASGITLKDMHTFPLCT